ncbi:MAG: cell division protein CrgA [Actinomycetia bacterium]|nr:cell division protein CrgA [Actinomycetes bacterium]
MGKDADTTSAGDEESKPKADKPLPPSAKRKKKTVSPSAGSAGSTDAGGRYTAPVPASKRGPSPRWVPVLMFALWVVGLAMILLNYMGLLPGTEDAGNGFYLVGGLTLILGGIVTATQYR